MIAPHTHWRYTGLEGGLKRGFGSTALHGTGVSAKVPSEWGDALLWTAWSPRKALKRQLGSTRNASS
jgi:hypothetical protein